MKKIIILALTLVLTGSAAYAVGSENAGQQGIHEAGTGLENPELQQAGQGTGQGQQVQTETQTQNQGETQQVQTQAQTSAQVQSYGENAQGQAVQQRAGSIEEARQMIQANKQEMSQGMQALVAVEQEVYQNQNRVREAVHALLAVEDLVGGIGQQVSEIAQEFNNSVKKTAAAEGKILKRNAFVRFFMGGDKTAAGELEQELNQNMLRIQELTQLREDCNCTEEVKTLMQEQVQKLATEQNRLESLKEKEINTNGVFGWIRSLFGN